MKITDILLETGNDSSDYQQMQDFVKANRVGGVPQDQQVALALFKELKRQREQNQALSSELSDAEQRIDQAMQSGELSKKELGMHRGELERERQAGQQQKAAVSQLGQQYTEREQASKEQMSQLTSQLDAIKDKPGVDNKAAKELETQIEQLRKNSVPSDKIAELEAHIASVQTMQRVDDTVIKDLVAQVNSAQEANASRVDLATQMRQDLERLKQAEANLEQEFAELQDSYKETDATLWDIESKSLPSIDRDLTRLKAKVGAPDIPPYFAPSGQGQPTTPPMPVKPPQPAQQQAANNPQYTPGQLATARKLGLSGDLETDTPSFAVAEAAFNRSIEWATGKTK